MTATFTAENVTAGKRRTSPTPPRPLRELPVLFHLIDVSRPKGFSAPPAFTLAAGPEPATLGAAESFDLETAAELVQTKAYGSLPADLPGPSLDAAAHVSAPPSEESTAGEIGPSLPELVAERDALASDLNRDPALETPPPASDESVNLRQRAEERQRKRQGDKKDDWFHTQGRYIAIGFVLTLLATIYLARTNRKSPAPPVAAKAKATATSTAAKVKAAAAKASTKSTKSTQSPSAASITAVRPTEKSPASEPKTALHPPTIPQLAQEPATTTAPSTDTLFTFSKSAEDRLAARTDGPTSTQPTGTALPLSAAPSGPPQLQPQYPSTSFPGNYQPVAPGPSTTSAPAYGPAPATGPASSPAGTTPLYPTTNSASGIRYERTGSSIY
jgi:hypothetical protein